MSILDSIKSLDEVKLIRCIIKREYKDYFKAQDYQKNKYVIAKNEKSKNFSKGLDDTFYAIKEVKTIGKFFKREIYHPIKTVDYLKLKVKFEE